MSIIENLGKKGWNVDYLKKVRDDEAMKTMESIKELRSDYRSHSQGKTKDKVFRHVMRIPFHALHGIHADPTLLKLFDNRMDVHERKKAMDYCAKKYPQYLTVDRY